MNSTHFFSQDEINNLVKIREYILNKKYHFDTTENFYLYLGKFISMYNNPNLQKIFIKVIFNNNINNFSACKNRVTEILNNFNKLNENK